MTPSSVIYELLAASAAVIGLVPAGRLRVDEISQGTPMPAISIDQISIVPIGAIDAQAEFSLVTARVQVTVHAKGRPDVDVVMAAVRRACNYQRGLLVGLRVSSILCDIEGPDMKNSDIGIYYRTMDFLVTFHEPH